MPTVKTNITVGEKNLGEIEIGNITYDGSRMSSDYLWRINAVDARRRPIVVCGFIVDSCNGSALELVAEVLAEWKSGRKYPIDNHGKERLYPEGYNMSAEDMWKRIDGVRVKVDWVKEEN